MQLRLNTFWKVLENPSVDVKGYALISKKSFYLETHPELTSTFFGYSGVILTTMIKVK